MFTKLAIRNVLRNKRRTAFSLCVILIGVSILYLVNGFITNSLEMIEETLITQLGAVQIADSRLFENLTEDYDYLMGLDTVANVVEELETDPRYEAHTTQLNVRGLIGNRSGSTPLIAFGVVPGNAILDYSDFIVEGSALDPNDDTLQILIDRAMAETLNVGVNDVLTIASGSVSGSFNAISATIKGIFLINNQTNEGLQGYVSLETAKRILKTDGVERIIVKLRDLDEAVAFADAMQNRLDERGIDLEVRPWQELSQFYESIQQFWGVFSLFTTIGVFVLVFFSVMEVLTMSFLERTREVGTVRAIGTQQSQLFRMFLTEGAVIGVIGGLLGVLGGLGISLVVNGAGLTWSPPGALEPIPVLIGTGPSVAILPYFTAIISTLLSAIYPSVKTARMNIVKALSYV